MANVIQIKRNTYTSTGDPTALAYGELGWNNNNGDGGNLWIGSQRDNNNPATITEELINKPVLGTSSQIDVTESASAFTVALTTNPTITGKLTVNGDLQVDGTTTTINSTTVTVEDKTFVVADGANASASDGAGFFVSNVASLLYEHTGTKWEARVGNNYATFKAATFEGNLSGNVTGNVTGGITGDVTGNADTATALETARTIGGVSFNGTANINLPGVNATGNQNTTGNAATATQLATARTIGGVSFNGTANINLPGVNTAGNQNTTGNAATATALATARTIGGVSFDGTANINLPGVNTAGNQNTTGSAGSLVSSYVIDGGSF